MKQNSAPPKSSVCWLHFSSFGSDKLALLTTSVNIYLFLCIYGDTYVSLTARWLSKQVKEHNSRWVKQEGIETISNSMVAHGPSIESQSISSIVCRVPQQVSKSLDTGSGRSSYHSVLQVRTLLTTAISPSITISLNDSRPCHARDWKLLDKLT